MTPTQALDAVAATNGGFAANATNSGTDRKNTLKQPKTAQNNGSTKKRNSLAEACKDVKKKVEK
eukprot:4338189-Ditylum_brightwellii.AAC.1